MYVVECSAMGSNVMHAINIVFSRCRQEIDAIVRRIIQEA